MKIRTQISLLVLLLGIVLSLQQVELQAATLADGIREKREEQIYTLLKIAVAKSEKSQAATPASAQEAISKELDQFEKDQIAEPSLIKQLRENSRKLSSNTNLSKEQLENEIKKIVHESMVTFLSSNGSCTKSELSCKDNPCCSGFTCTQLSGLYNSQESFSQSSTIILITDLPAQLQEKLKNMEERCLDIGNGRNQLDCLNTYRAQVAFYKENYRASILKERADNRLSCKFFQAACTKDTECCSKNCKIESGKTEGSCGDSYICLPVAAKDEYCIPFMSSCSDKMTYCRDYTTNSTHLPICKELKESCQKDSDCCSGKCLDNGSGKTSCLKASTCQQCAQQGEEPTKERACCPGYYQGLNGKCISDLPPASLLSQLTNSLKKIIVIASTLLIEEADAGTLLNYCKAKPNPDPCFLYAPANSSTPYYVSGSEEANITAQQTANETTCLASHAAQRQKIQDTYNASCSATSCAPAISLTGAPTLPYPTKVACLAAVSTASTAYCNTLAENLDFNAYDMTCKTASQDAACLLLQSVCMQNFSNEMTASSNVKDTCKKTINAHSLCNYDKYYHSSDENSSQGMRSQAYSSCQQMADGAAIAVMNGRDPNLSPGYPAVPTIPPPFACHCSGQQLQKNIANSTPACSDPAETCYLSSYISCQSSSQSTACDNSGTGSCSCYSGFGSCNFPFHGINLCNYGGDFSGSPSCASGCQNQIFAQRAAIIDPWINKVQEKCKEDAIGMVCSNVDQSCMNNLMTESGIRSSNEKSSADFVKENFVYSRDAAGNPIALTVGADITASLQTLLGEAVNDPSQCSFNNRLGDFLALGPEERKNELDLWIFEMLARGPSTNDAIILKSTTNYRGDNILPLLNDSNITDHTWSNLNDQCSFKIIAKFDEGPMQPTNRARFAMLPSLFSLNGLFHTDGKSLSQISKDVADKLHDTRVNVVPLYKNLDRNEICNCMNTKTPDRRNEIAATNTFIGKIYETQCDHSQSYEATSTASTAQADGIRHALKYTQLLADKADIIEKKMRTTHESTAVLKLLATVIEEFPWLHANLWPTNITHKTEFRLSGWIGFVVYAVTIVALGVLGATGIGAALIAIGSFAVAVLIAIGSSVGAPPRQCEVTDSQPNCWGPFCYGETTHTSCWNNEIRPNPLCSIKSSNAFCVKNLVTMPDEGSGSNITKYWLIDPWYPEGSTQPPAGLDMVSFLTNPTPTPPTTQFDPAVEGNTMKLAIKNYAKQILDSNYETTLKKSDTDTSGRNLLIADEDLDAFAEYAMTWHFYLKAKSRPDIMAYTPKGLKAYFDMIANAGQNNTNQLVNVDSSVRKRLEQMSGWIDSTVQDLCGAPPSVMLQHLQMPGFTSTQTGTGAINTATRASALQTDAFKNNCLGNISIKDLQTFEAMKPINQAKSIMLSQAIAYRFTNQPVKYVEVSDQNRTLGEMSLGDLHDILNKSNAINKRSKDEADNYMSRVGNTPKGQALITAAKESYGNGSPFIATVTDPNYLSSMNKTDSSSGENKAARSKKGEDDKDTAFSSGNVDISKPKNILGANGTGRIGTASETVSLTQTATSKKSTMEEDMDKFLKDLEHGDLKIGKDKISGKDFLSDLQYTGAKALLESEKKQDLTDSKESSGDNFRIRNNYVSNGARSGQNEIHKNGAHTIFKIISARYITTGYPKLLIEENK